MVGIEQSCVPVSEIMEYPAAARFTVWPDPGVGYRVVELRTQTWATGAQRTLAEAFEAMWRLNRQEAALAGDLAPLSE
jgi:hypothetical protein